MLVSGWVRVGNIVTGDARILSRLTALDERVDTNVGRLGVLDRQTADLDHTVEFHTRQNTFATEAAFTIVDPAGMLGIAITGGSFDPANLAGWETWTPVGHFGVGKAERSFDSDYIF